MSCSSQLGSGASQGSVLAQESSRQIPVCLLQHGKKREEYRDVPGLIVLYAIQKGLKHFQDRFYVMAWSQSLEVGVCLRAGRHAYATAFFCAICQSQVRDAAVQLWNGTVMLANQTNKQAMYTNLMQGCLQNRG